MLATQSLRQRSHLCCVLLCYFLFLCPVHLLLLWIHCIWDILCYSGVEERMNLRKTLQNNCTFYCCACARVHAHVASSFNGLQQPNRNRKWKEKKQRNKENSDHDPAWWYWQFYLCVKQFLSNSLGFEAAFLLRDFSSNFSSNCNTLFKQFGYENKTFLQTFLFWNNTVSQIERTNLSRQIEFQERLRTFQAF